MSRETIAERVEVPGVRPATFRLRWKAEGSFDLYRSSRKLGRARVEEDGDWTARFEATGKRWLATAASGEDLLGLVDIFLLAQEAKEVSPPPKDNPPDNRSVTAAERKLSAKWQDLQEKRRIARLDELIREARKRIRPAKA